MELNIFKISQVNENYINKHESDFIKPEKSTNLCSLNVIKTSGSAI
jgi:hypothetical protein